jgi:excisionase family DNA binding protein
MVNNAARATSSKGKPFPERRQLRSIDYAAEVLNCSTDSVRRLIASGKIRSVKIGALRRIPDQELDRLASSGSGE